GDRERTLEIMKDPRSGPAAIVAIVLVLLAKFAALQALLAGGEALYPLLLAPVLGRTVVVLLLLATP
ncbi:adenosylcobinamide-GDP ribazoletransferase, partial [Arthrospira platensis SPKY1]|nr:adenosylcobinamide-GDP ribazoletransferase [Arthrospira platensis SPKY1]